MVKTLIAKLSGFSTSLLIFRLNYLKEQVFSFNVKYLKRDRKRELIQTKKKDKDLILNGKSMIVSKVNPEVN